MTKIIFDIYHYHYCSTLKQIDVPTASSVAVVINNVWTQLERKQDTMPWQGAANTTSIPNGQKVAICANFGTGKDSYSTLLEYDS